jgi:hypothetical protein
MVQLWVNLPAMDKLAPPAYQPILDAEIPSVALSGGAGAVRVIAGSYWNVKGPARTFTPMNVWDVRLKAGGDALFDAPDGHTAIVVVLSGRVVVSGVEAAGGAQAVLLDRSGDGLSISADEDSTILLLSGEPIDEPIVGYGPFVMNSQQEIRQALTDFRSGRFGEITAPAERDVRAS